MAWQQVAAQFIRTGGPTQFFWETGPREAGDFQLWLAGDGQVQGFQLSYTRRANQPQHWAAWQRGQALRVGEVDSGESSGRSSGRARMSPIVRTAQQPAAQIVDQLLEYFDRNATELAPDQREVVRSILSAARTA